MKSKRIFTEDMKHTWSIDLERLGIMKQKGFRVKRDPAQVLNSWKSLKLHDPINYTQFHDFNNRVNPATGLPWKFLVNMARLYLDKDGSRRSVLLKNYEDQMSSWDVISTSLISNIRPDAVIGEIGHILDVPPQNILSTNETDVYVENHVGRDKNSPVGKVIKPYALADHIKERSNLPKYYDYSFYGQLNQHAKRLKASEYLLTPEELEILTIKSKQSSKVPHNEIVVIGRPGVNLYSGMPTTSKIKVKGIYLIRKFIQRKGRHVWNEYLNLAYSMSEVNNNVPIIFINV